MVVLTVQSENFRRTFNWLAAIIVHSNVPLDGIVPFSGPPQPWRYEVHPKSN